MALVKYQIPRPRIPEVGEVITYITGPGYGDLHVAQTGIVVGYTGDLCVFPFPLLDDPLADEVLRFISPDEDWFDQALDSQTWVMVNWNDDHWHDGA